MATAAINNQKDLHQQIGFKFYEETSKALCGAETWTIQKVDKKYQEINECGAGEGWRRSVGQKG
jgi:uncharacterized protein YacL (UPF0231 family)